MKGIRVNQLAKELGVPSKLILDRCKQEGLGEKVPNHMSLMSLGLAETVREWFAGAGGGVATAVETATEAAAEEAHEGASKPKAPRRRKKAEGGAAHAEEHGGEEHVQEEEHPGEEEAEKGEEVLADEKPQEQPVVEVAPPVAEPPVTVAEVPQVAEPAKPVAQPVEKEPVVVPPVAEPVAPVAKTIATPPPVVPPAPALKPAATVPPVAGRTGPQNRPTVRLGDRAGGGAPPVRKPVIPAPQLLVPAPAKIQGPKIVREEAPEVVQTPRRRSPLNEGPQGGPSFVQARPQAGRGVRSTGTDGEEGEESAEAKKKAAKGRTLSARRRGPDGRRGEADAAAKLREFNETDLAERRTRLANAGHARSIFETHLDKAQTRGTHALAKTPVEKGGPVQVEEPVTVKNLAAALGVKTNDIMTKLMKQGIMANVNQALDNDSAEMIALEYGIELKVVAQATLEEQLEQRFASRASDEGNLRPRPPVVTILGHVDHGKTSLLDKIRHANVAAGEAGGITQHTAAWMVELSGKRVTFIDTPGHQAFTAMRARGANMTDIVVLVVSAAEGVQPQTIESINHARAAEVPIVVAMNKIDRPDANADMVLGQLAAQGLNPVEWGGDTEVVRTSAVTGDGIPNLIEILDLQASIMELKADPTLSARGTVIESRVDEGLGPVATVLVQDGTLKVGDVILSGPGYGRIRSLFNDRMESVQEAGPSTPVIVSGFNSLPGAGDKFYVTDNLDSARSIAEERQSKVRMAQLAAQNRVTTGETLADRIKAGESKIINVIIKADVQGSAETLVNSVTDANTEEVKVRVIHSGVGPITESDVQLAIATKAKPTDNRVGIIGFHVVPDEAALALAEQNHVDIKTYRVIYEIFDDLKKSLSGMLEPEIREKHHGRIEIRKVFKVSRVGSVAGCYVTEGHVLRGSKIRLIRNGAIVAEDLALESLKRLKDDVREVKAGLECGLKIAGYDDIKEGDMLDAYSRETIERTL